MTDYKFEGWVGENPEAAKGNMVWKEYEPKEWEETDIDIKITHNGICGSDMHTISNGWVRYLTNPKNMLVGGIA
jgi:alcohol dehydrogenase (NADP+)